MGLDYFLRYAKLMTASIVSGIRLGVALDLIQCSAAQYACEEFSRLERRINNLIEGPVLLKRGGGR